MSETGMYRAVFSTYYDESCDYCGDDQCGSQTQKSFDDMFSLSHYERDSCADFPSRIFSHNDGRDGYEKSTFVFHMGRGSMCEYDNGGTIEV